MIVMPPGIVLALIVVVSCVATLLVVWLTAPKRKTKPTAFDFDKFTDAITNLLAMQMVVCTNTSIVGADGTPNMRAVAYIAGYVAAALSSIGYSESPIPTTYAIMARLFPGHEGSLFTFWSRQLEAPDPAVAAALTYGEAQYRDGHDRKIIPMGLARLLLTGESLDLERKLETELYDAAAVAWARRRPE